MTAIKSVSVSVLSPATVRTGKLALARIGSKDAAITPAQTALGAVMLDADRAGNAALDAVLSRLGPVQQAAFHAGLSGLLARKGVAIWGSVAGAGSDDVQMLRVQNAVSHIVKATGGDSDRKRRESNRIATKRGALSWFVSSTATGKTCTGKDATHTATLEAPKGRHSSGEYQFLIAKRETEKGKSDTDTSPAPVASVSGLIDLIGADKVARQFKALAKSGALVDGIALPSATVRAADVKEAQAARDAAIVERDAAAIRAAQFSADLLLVVDAARAAGVDLSATVDLKRAADRARDLRAAAKRAATRAAIRAARGKGKRGRKAA